MSSKFGSGCGQTISKFTVYAILYPVFPPEIKSLVGSSGATNLSNEAFHNAIRDSEAAFSMFKDRLEPEPSTYKSGIPEVVEMAAHGAKAK